MAADYCLALPAPARPDDEAVLVSRARAGDHARGTLTVLGADGRTHDEAFHAADGALFWEADGMAFLLHGAASKGEAARLAASLR
jgi:hypothetical protein